MWLNAPSEGLVVQNIFIQKQHMFSRLFNKNNQHFKCKYLLHIVFETFCYISKKYTIIYIDHNKQKKMKTNNTANIVGQDVQNQTAQNNSPTLNDSKSMTYLNSHLGQPRKYRQTTFYPVTTKNKNYQFLRFTVNMHRNQKQKNLDEGIPTNFTKMNRKMTEQIPPTHQQKPNSKQAQKWKFQAKGLFSPKKNLNSEKKNEYKEGKNNLAESAKLEKRTTTQIKTISHNNSVTDRVDRAKNQNSIIKQTIPKKIFTPQFYRVSEASKQAKIASSFSSADLLKDHANSPTSESVSSRVALKLETDNPVISLTDFLIVKYLGQGKFGQVNLAYHKQSHAIFALKQIKKEVIKKNKMEEQLLMQIKMQSFFNHPNILKLYGFFSDDQNIYLVLEYMEEGTLYSQLRKQKALKQFDASKKLRDILDGVSYLHKMNIAHRDIKPENIVVSNDVCKICDFGWAAICEDRRKTLCGTIDYASPQLLEGKDYDIAIDLWCLGVLCFQLMVGKAPFYHISRKQTMKKIINADTSDISIPVNVPNETKDFIHRLLRKNPQQRMSAQQSLMHPLIMKYRDQELEDFRLASKRRN